MVVARVEDELGTLVDRYCSLGHWMPASHGFHGACSFQGCCQGLCHTGVLEAISPIEIVETVVKEFAVCASHCVSSQESDHVRDVETASSESSSRRSHAEAGTG